MTTSIFRPDVALIVVTRNAQQWWPDWIRGIQQQTVRVGRYLLIDSSSEDQTTALATAAGFEVVSIDPQTFNHGGTRQLAASLCPQADFLVYMTQDAILTQPDSLQKLLQSMEDPSIGLAYGRHIPRTNADCLEKHARLFSYPAQSSRREGKNIANLGYRAAFASDVYAVYRADALRSVGGFPAFIIANEDSYLAARLLLKGWACQYQAESTVEHSHHYSMRQIFQRYFDIGVFHATHADLLKTLGANAPDKQAGSYIYSLLLYLYQQHKSQLPLALMQTLVKWLGFCLGKYFQILPLGWCKRLSMQNAYWHQLSIRSQLGRSNPIEMPSETMIEALMPLSNVK